MVARIIEILSAFIVATISALGYPGIVLLMGIESACIPLPSEVIMPFSGYLVYTGRFNLWAVSVAGAAGCVIGSLAAYWVGMYGGRPLIEKVRPLRLDFASRSRPRRSVVRAPRRGDSLRQPTAPRHKNLHRVSSRRRENESLSIRRLHISWIASVVPRARLFGQKLGEQWDKNDTLKTWFHRFDFVIAIIAVLTVVWWVWRHIKESRADNSSERKVAKPGPIGR